MNLLPLRPGERRDAWIAFATLFGLIGSHSMLETARDALFLARVPASNLPWVFLGVALLSLGVARLNGMLGGRVGARRALAVSACVAGAITLAFFALLHRLGPRGLYALYVWSGLLTTMLLVRFWSLVGNLFSVTQAKRLYGFIGAGSVLGALAGTGSASALARHLPAERLLLVSALGFFATAGVPLLFRPAGGRARTKAESAASSSIEGDLRVVRESPYAQRVVAVLLVSTIGLTLADYLFKSMVATLIPKEQLGSFLGSVYFALNFASLMCQLFVVGRVIKRLSLGAALAILPFLLALGGIGIVATGGLAAVLMLKGADGALRYSLHRTTSELLFLPFSDETRQRVKSFVDVVAQRGGQMVASAALLVIGSASPRLLAMTVAGVAAGWFFAALALRQPYIDVFRTRLQTGRIAHLDEFPQLDVASLETLVASLDSKQDKEVLIALQVLERERKTHIVPALILYHPSVAVVELALAIFTRARRRSAVHVIDRVIDHPSPRVRAAAIAARSVLAPDAQTLLLRMSLEESSEVRTTITVNLIAAGDIYGADAQERIDALLKRGTAQTKVALADAIAARDAERFDEVLVSLSSATEADVRLAAVAAMARLARPKFADALVARLAEEATRDAAHQALARLGGDALAALERALEAKDSPRAVRWRIPHAMTFLDPHASATALLTWLPREREGGVRFQIIRALERLTRRVPDLALERPILRGVIDQTIARAALALESRIALARGVDKTPARKTAGYELLTTTLQHKEKNAIERLFRLLALAYPGEDFAEIYRGLGASKERRATSSELIDNILSGSLRTTVRGLVDDLSDEERLGQTSRSVGLFTLDYDALLERLGSSESEVVREVAHFHVGELA